MYVHILEDIKEQRESLKKMIKRGITEHKYDMEIGIVESDPKRFLDELEKDFKEPAIFLIDVELKAEMTGFNAGVRIRELEMERDVKSHLIYMTASDERMPLTFEYKLAVLDVISKSNIAVLQAGITECLRKIERERKNTEIPKNFLTINFLKREIRIAIEDIVYISTSKLRNNITIVLEDGCKNLPATIKEMEDKLQEYNFFRLSESVLINPKKIKELDMKNKKVTLNTGTEFEILYCNLRKLKRGVKD